MTTTQSAPPVAVVLRVYADESGTMPVGDDDGVFVGACIAIPGDYPSIGNRNGHVGWLVRQIVASRGVPYLAYLMPRAGYRAMLEAKLSKMDTMARWRRLLDGSNALYLNPDGLHLRNYIWLVVMQQCLARAVGYAAIRNPIRRIELYLDQKTLTNAETRVMFRQALRIPTNLKAALDSARAAFPDEAAKAERNIASEAVAVHWSDEPSAAPAADGLALAHYLSHLGAKDLRKPSPRGVGTLLANSGFDCFRQDITEILVAPISREAIERWKAHTGLPEPE